MSSVCENKEVFSEYYENFKKFRCHLLWSLVRGVTRTGVRPGRGGACWCFVRRVLPRAAAEVRLDQGCFIC